MKRFEKLNKFEAHYKSVMIYAPKMLANDALNFFLDRFKDQAWIGYSREPWLPRKKQSRWSKTPRNKGRAILIDRGRLRRSIRITMVQSMMARIGTDVPYAAAHNNGLRLGFIQQVKSYERKLTKLGIVATKSLKTRTNIKFGRVQTGKTRVRAHTRKIDMKLPKRQYMGKSPYLAKQLSRRLLAEIKKGLR